MDNGNETTICRVCINDIEVTDKCSYIFTKNGDSPDKEYDDILIADKIIALAKVDIKEGDGLPNRICSYCLVELENSFKFKRKCEKSDDILRIAERYSGLYLVGQDQEIPSKEGECEYVDTDESAFSSSESQQSDASDDSLPECDEIDSDPLTVNAESEKMEPDHNYSHVDGVSFNSSESSEPKSDKTLPIKYTRNDNIKLIDKIITESEFVQHAHKNNQVKKTKTKSDNLVCKDCGNMFINKCDLQLHRKKEHKRIFTCPNCKRQFKSYKSFKLHEKVKSKICLSASKARIVGEGQSMVLYCKECDYNTNKRENMVNHFVIHSTERPFSCDICTKSYTRLQSLKFHKEHAHKQYIGERTCPICRKVILGNYKYVEHMKKHKQKQVQCDVCAKFLSSKPILINHMRRHSGTKHYTCKICASKFYTSPELSNHKKVHGAKQTYSCRICGYKSPNCYKINRHEKKHTASNVACAVCGMFMEDATQLALHVKRHEDRPHKCIHCKKTYCSKISLKIHLRDKHKDFISKEIKREVKTETVTKCPTTQKSIQIDVSITKEKKYPN